MVICCHTTSGSAAHATHCATHVTPCRPLIRAFPGGFELHLLHEEGEGHRRPAFFGNTISIAVPDFGIGSTGCVGWGGGYNFRTCTARETIFPGISVAFFCARKCASSILRGDKRSMGPFFFVVREKTTAFCFLFIKNPLEDACPVVPCYLRERVLY